MPSIALVGNVYNDAKALRGLLEVGAPFFDNLFFIHSGPGGARSTDGTIELLNDFGATVVMDDMDRGFGAIRTRAVRECGCEWAMIMDADERFYPRLPIMLCDGTEKYPETPNPNLRVTKREGELCDQGVLLHALIGNPSHMAVRATRRHWFDFTMNRPTQNWFIERDHQLRIVRNIPEIAYRADVKMHEKLTDSRTGQDPVYAEQGDFGGIFIDHFHCFFRRTQPGHKESNEVNYGRLERGESMLA